MPFEKLIEGFRSFHKSYFEDHNPYDALTQNGQDPEALVIACSDSRNDPALLTQSEPGDIFVIRNVAAIVPPYQPDDRHHGTSAAIEFAVCGLKVKNIVVIGHALCGGVKALAERPGNADQDQFEFLRQWISIGSPALDAVDRLLPGVSDSVRLRALEQALILTSLNNLMTFPWIREAVDAGQMALHGWYFDMVNGRMLTYDFTSGQFRDMGDGTACIGECTTESPSCCEAWPLEKLVRGHLKQA